MCGRARLAIPLCVLALAGCRDSLAALTRGAAPQRASAADELFAALSARVSDPYRDPKYDHARRKIAEGAFIPSRIWSDTATWTASAAARRSLQVTGRYRLGRYELAAVTDAPAPARLADGRHVIDLTRLADNEYAWNTEVTYALGRIGAAEVGGMIGLLLAGASAPLAARRTEADVRGDARATIPRAARVLGQLFRVDSVRVLRLADGSSLAAYAATLRPEGIEARYPNFARYLRRYGNTARMRFVLGDSTDAYLDAALRDGRMTLRVRSTPAGALVSMRTAAAMPDTLPLHADVSLKIRRFTVGFSEYRGEFAIVRTPNERTLSLVSRIEPKWDLPFIAERLLRTPLRRPFQGSGASFRIGVRSDPDGGQTLLLRRLHLEVQESAILRFIGRLGAAAVSDFNEETEREQYAWLKEVFDAFLADVRAFSAD